MVASFVHPESIKFPLKLMQTPGELFSGRRNGSVARSAVPPSHPGVDLRLDDPSVVVRLTMNKILVGLSAASQNG